MSDKEKLKPCCKYCSYFQYEDVGDSDFGGIYSDNKTCTNDELEEMAYGENIVDSVERNCCQYEFWYVLEDDKEIAEEYEKDIKQDECFEPVKSFSLFKEKYWV